MSLYIFVSLNSDTLIDTAFLITHMIKTYLSQWSRPLQKNNFVLVIPQPTRLLMVRRDSLGFRRFLLPGKSAESGPFLYSSCLLAPSLQNCPYPLARHRTSAISFCVMCVCRPVVPVRIFALVQRITFDATSSRACFRIGGNGRCLGRSGILGRFGPHTPNSRGPFELTRLRQHHSLHPQKKKKEKAGGHL